MEDREAGIPIEPRLYERVSLRMLRRLGPWQYCSGRGVCKADNKTLCDCWDPVRWSGDRCEISVCGEHGIVIDGDYTAGTHGHGCVARCD